LFCVIILETGYFPRNYFNCFYQQLSALQSIKKQKVLFHSVLTELPSQWPLPLGQVLFLLCQRLCVCRWA